MRRREFINLGLVASATAAIATMSAINAAQANKRLGAPPGVPALDPTDPQARALHYTEDATDAVFENGTTAADAGQSCANCQLYSGTPGRERGPCAIFSYRVDPDSKMNLVVSAAGWCQAWAPRAGARQ